MRETEEEERQRPYPVSTHLWSYSKPREVAEADEKEEEDVALRCGLWKKLVHAFS